MSRYGKHLSTKLITRLEELQGATPDDVFTLSDEIGIARSLVERSILSYDKVVVNAEEADGEEKKSSAKLKAAVIYNLRENLEFLSRLVDRYASITSKIDGRVHLGQIGFVVAQVAKIVGDGVKDPKEQERILERIGCIEISDGKDAAGQDYARLVKRALAEMDELIPKGAA